MICYKVLDDVAEITDGQEDAEGNLTEFCKVKFSDFLNQVLDEFCAYLSAEIASDYYAEQ